MRCGYLVVGVQKSYSTLFLFPREVLWPNEPRCLRCLEGDTGLTFVIAVKHKAKQYGVLLERDPPTRVGIKVPF